MHECNTNGSGQAMVWEEEEVEGRSGGGGGHEGEANRTPASKCTAINNEK